MEGHRFGTGKSPTPSHPHSPLIHPQITAPPPPNATPDDPAAKAVDGSLTFTDVVNTLQTVYKEKALADISTSYCFICVLHLANEKGLVIENVDGWENLTVKRDFEAQVSEGDI